MFQQFKAWFNRIYRGGALTNHELRKRGLTIGENCHIYTNRIDYGHGYLISIGNNVTISSARILAHDGATKKILGYSKVGRVDIGNDVFIGADAVILPNVKIGNRVIVGAGSVVSRNIPDNSVAVGNPAHVVGTYDSFVNKNTELLKTALIQDTPYANKSEEEKKRMKEILLESGWGFDI
jgi:maltose O-acetyltransferase